jgi:hypothetical protein
MVNNKIEYRLVDWSNTDFAVYLVLKNSYLTRYRDTNLSKGPIQITYII